MNENRKSNIANTLEKNGIPQKISKLIESRNLSLRETADRSGVSVEYIRKLIAGKIKNPGIETLKKLSLIFNISILDLISQEQQIKMDPRIRLPVLCYEDLLSEDMMTKIYQANKKDFFLIINDTKHIVFALSVDKALSEKIKASGCISINPGDHMVFSDKMQKNNGNLCIYKSNDNGLKIGIYMDENNTNHSMIKTLNTPILQTIEIVEDSALSFFLSSVTFS